MTLARYRNQYRVTESECRKIRRLDKNGLSRKEIRLMSGRQYNTLKRHIDGDCGHWGENDE